MLKHGYVVVPFVPGYEDVAREILKPDHIDDPDLHSLDEFFRDHFVQCDLKNMKGAGEPAWYEGALGDMRIDLSRLDIWGGQTVREHLEFELAHRLHWTLVEQEHGDA